MLPAYACIYKLVSILTNHSKFKISKCKLSESFVFYNQIQVFAGLVNDCFREYMSFPILVDLMICSMVHTIVLVHKSLRSTTSTPILLYLIVVVVLCCILMAFAYALPAQANEMSKQTQGVWKSLIFEENIHRKARKEYYRIVLKSQDIRIGFGTFNYFEKLTPLVICNFLLEKIATLCLIF